MSSSRLPLVWRSIRAQARHRPHATSRDMKGRTGAKQEVYRPAGSVPGLVAPGSVEKRSTQRGTPVAGAAQPVSILRDTSPMDRGALPRHGGGP
jgi:hypothetical protein